MTTDVTATSLHTVGSADGTVIAYEKAGSGPPLVLVDGALCSRSFGPSRAVAAALADRYTVFVYDRRGRGDSGNTAHYAVQREVEDLAAVIAAAAMDSADPDAGVYVMGQSSGGALVLEAAASGVRMRKLATYEAPYVGPRMRSGERIDDLATLRGLLDLGDRGGAVGYFLVDMVGAPFFMPLMMRAMRKVWRELQSVAHTLPYDAAVMDGFEVPAARFATIAVPALVLGGGKGKPNMKAAVNAVANAIPGSRREELAGQTHQVSEKVLAPVLRDFFRD